MAKSDVTSDDQRAADVPKVERVEAQNSQAAKAAERVEQPAPDSAHERAEDLAQAEEAPQEPEVQVQLTGAIEFEGEGIRVRARTADGHRVEVVLQKGSTETVPESHAVALEASGAVERVESTS